MTGAPETRLFRRTQIVGDWARAHPFLVDAAFAGLVFIFATLDVAGGGVSIAQRDPGPLTYVLLAGQTLPFAIRRNQPFTAMYLMVGSLSVYWMLDYPAGSDASGLVAIYSAVLYGANRAKAWANATIAILVMTAAASLLATSFFVDEEEGFSPLVVIAVLLLHSLAAVFGEVMHQRRKWLADLQERASQAEAAVETTARLAVAQERTRIAREMHDVVAHGISVISVQAAAGQEVLQSDPDRASGIFADIEETGREALTEMRRMLGVLRNGDHQPDALTPQPSLADLDHAIAHCVEAGLPTEVAITGQPRALPPGIELAAFRIIQEALTNALKHGGDTTAATVDLHFSESGLDIKIADTGRGAISNLSSTGGGNGLIGMRERVEAYDGEFSAGPKPGGGYRVTARFPTSDRPGQQAIRSAEAAERQEIT